MDKETRGILDRFCADKIDVEEAARALNTSIVDFLELADGYEYIPTLDEVREANEIVRATYNHIKYRALQKIETKARSKIFVPQSISIPAYGSFTALKTCMRVDMMSHHEIKNLKVYRPLGFKTSFWERFGEEPHRKKHRQVGQSRARSDLLKTYSYCPEPNKMRSCFEEEQKLKLGA